MPLSVTFDVDPQVNIDQVNGQNRVAQAQPNLPADVNQFGLTYRSTVGLPLVVFAVYSPKGSYDSLFLGNYAVININDALYRVNGVGQVLNFGLAEYAMRIWAKPDPLAKLGLTVPDLGEGCPSDMEYTASLDTTAPITEGIREIATTILEAIALVILVVFVFLQNWRATLIPLIAVPVSLVGPVALFPLLGFSINTLSLFALVLAIGLVVDDAIVVVEAVEHHIEEGLAPREATLEAMSEVSGPVIGIALVLSAVFIPIAFIGGIQGRLNQQFAVTIAIAVVISAFNALSLSPALCALLLRPRRESRGVLGRLFGAFNRGFARATHGYVDLSHGLIRKTALGLAILAVFAVLAGGIGRRLPSGFIADEDQGFLIMNVQLPDAASLQRTGEVTRRIEDLLKNYKGVKHVVTINGFSLLTRTAASYTAFLFVTLEPWHERTGAALTSSAILTGINRELRARVPEAIAFAFAPPAIPGIGNAGGFSFWLQDRSGGSVEFLADNLQKFLDAARKRPERANVNTPFRGGVPQVYANVDRDKVLQQGFPEADD